MRRGLYWGWAKKNIEKISWHPRWASAEDKDPGKLPLVHFKPCVSPVIEDGKGRKKWTWFSTVKRNRNARETEKNGISTKLRLSFFIGKSEINRRRRFKKKKKDSIFWLPFGIRGASIVGLLFAIYGTILMAGYLCLKFLDTCFQKNFSTRPLDVWSLLFPEYQSSPCLHPRPKCREKGERVGVYKWENFFE